MALVSCTECGRQVSTNAVACPACGNPTPAYRRQARSPATGVAAILGGVALLAVLVLVGAFFYFRGRVVPDVRMDPAELVEFMEDGDGAPPPAVAPPEDGIYEISAVESPPELLNRAELARTVGRHYPPLLRDAGVTGSAALRLAVGTDGAIVPGTARVDESTHPLFADAAMAVAGEMRFRPATLNGAPVKVWAVVPVVFALER
jgi:TonB family protein